MSNVLVDSPETTPFISKPTETTVIPIKDSTIDVEHSSSSVTISKEQFQELLKHVGDSNRTQSGIANPGALGLGGFALTTFILSVFNAGSYLINIKLEPVVLPVALFYGGLAQFLAGMWEFKVNNTFGATAFTSYGSFWMSFAGYVHFIVPQIKQAGNVKKATGLFLLAWFIFTLIMNVAAAKTSKFLFILFTVLNITFLLLIIGNLGGLPLIVNIGGWFGILTAFVAWYGCAAIVINSTFKKSLLPLGPLA
ncbi:unnamed protein product [Rotaria socialis]|uniref:Uncharacterized protein n=2 Tax=Rotaria socialis TaxID=392032 RepID=A0A818KFT4_9BILA|nr:unnamed protein product [Rotaria socialis]CAF3331629.1 unnamed protein product [Rotaria socialis]CAF3388691.1 unnamed protein product [Rotaria socialis]CAF3555439.1 unnamed protein product [Rotaria socialis]CAF3627690.1 unnamed protein product [Rotaria socialis]